MIIGLTDRPVLRRDGKIRAGHKDGSKLVNTEHFLLYDAPQLASVLGENPKEIYFTLHTNNVREVCRTDLRWYNANQNLCRSMHGAPDAAGNPMGSVAAYMGVKDVSGMSQQPFPGVPSARLRTCLYKTCPDYVQGNCTEHMFLDVMVPQYSMGEIFTLDSTSINAVLNVMSTLTKTATRYGGRIAGQIFRMYKKEGEITYLGQSGEQKKRKAPMVAIDHVPFEKYEEMFRTQIRPEDWDALMWLRNGAAQSVPNYELAGRDVTAHTAAIGGQVQSAAPAIVGQVVGNEQSDEDVVKARANHASLAPIFAELAAATGTANSEENRMKVAARYADINQMAKYLNDRLAKVKKNNKASTTPPKSEAVPTTATHQDGGLY